MYIPILETTKDIVDHYYHHMSLEMDPDVIIQQLNSLQLLRQNELRVITTGMSNYQKNCLILVKVRNMDMDSLTKFCKLLENFPHQKLIGTTLLNGKNIKIYFIVIMYFFYTKQFSHLNLSLLIQVRNIKRTSMLLQHPRVIYWIHKQERDHSSLNIQYL